jgi:hypothetical protein
MPNVIDLPVTNRRKFLTQALAGAAGATIAANTGDAARLPEEAQNWRSLGAVLTDLPADPILALIAEKRRLLDIGLDFRGRADRAFFALGDASERRRRFGDIEDEALPAPFGPLYAEAQRFEDASGEMLDRIVETKPVTLAGVIAQLEMSIAAEDDDLVVAALAGLRDIAAKGGAS